MALPKGTRVGTRSRLSSTRALLAGLAATAVWLLDVDELPLEMKTAEEMDVPGAPVTPAPAHAERNRPAPQARAPHELSLADSLVLMVTRRPDVPHPSLLMLNGRALLCVCSISEARNLAEPGDPCRGSATGIRDAARRPAGCLPG